MDVAQPKPGRGRRVAIIVGIIAIGALVFVLLDPFNLFKPKAPAEPAPVITPEAEEPIEVLVPGVEPVVVPGLECTTATVLTGAEILSLAKGFHDSSNSQAVMTPKPSPFIEVDNPDEKTIHVRFSFKPAKDTEGESGSDYRVFMYKFNFETCKWEVAGMGGVKSGTLACNLIKKELDNATIEKLVKGFIAKSNPNAIINVQEVDFDNDIVTGIEDFKSIHIVFTVSGTLGSLLPEENRQTNFKFDLDSCEWIIQNMREQGTGTKAVRNINYCIGTTGVTSGDITIPVFPAFTGISQLLANKINPKRVNFVKNSPKIGLPQGDPRLVPCSGTSGPSELGPHMNVFNKATAGTVPICVARTKLGDTKPRGKLFKDKTECNLEGLKQSSVFWAYPDKASATASVQPDSASQVQPGSAKPWCFINRKGPLDITRQEFGGNVELNVCNGISGNNVHFYTGA